MRTTEFLTIAAAIVPDRTAVHFDGEAVSFIDLQQRANQLANALADRGVGPGDRVAVMQVNCTPCIEIYFATAQLDAIYVPINFRAKTEELQQMLSIAQPKFMFIGERYLPLIPTDGEGAISSDAIVLLDGEATGGPDKSASDYQSFLAGASEEELLFPEAEDDDTTVIMFTAGTTGVPKGVMLTHDGFSSFLLSTVNPADPDIEESNLLAVPG